MCRWCIAQRRRSGQGARSASMQSASACLTRVEVSVLMKSLVPAKRPSRTCTGAAEMNKGARKGVLNLEIDAKPGQRTQLVLG